ncbi:hypothetical protein [Acetobacter malorum]|uniref:hypothetical protein n=1 Tax=Acetobacter malorum TaxID=178901 RepID=UPI000776BFC9|nr:hypothetical protein [Acetobacter malorum]KXV06783.1 hypothetical protein AD930_06705 [Acetobacter malorum]
MTDNIDRSVCRAVYEDGAYKVTGLTVNEDISRLKFDVKFSKDGAVLERKAFDGRGVQRPVPDKIKPHIGTTFGYVFHLSQKQVWEQPKQDALIPDWQERLSSIRDRFHSDLDIAAGCGPFDGGCLLVAGALQSVIGGDLVVLIRQNGFAEHAAVLKDGQLWDFDGPLPPAQFIMRFNENEHAACAGFRPLNDENDLMDAREIADNSLQDRLARLFEEVLPDIALERKSPQEYLQEHSPS